MEMKLAPLSAAAALATSVLPQPGERGSAAFACGAIALQCKAKAPRAGCHPAPQHTSSQEAPCLNPHSLRTRGSKQQHACGCPQAHGLKHLGMLDGLRDGERQLLTYLWWTGRGEAG